MQYDFCPAPPWRFPAEWREANQTLAYLIHRHGSELDQAVFLAREVRRGLKSIFPLMDELCLVACPHCPDPCCLVAKVWSDFRDLLFLHLSAQPIPPTQCMADMKDVCCYLGHRGCTQSRMTRPWMCTCYLCPPQMTMLRKKSRTIQDAFSHTVQAIKIGRKDMEHEFMRVVTQGISPY